MSLLGAALAGYQDADALDHLGGGAGALGQEDVGAAGAIEGVDSSGDDHRGEAGVELLGAADEFVAVHLGHDEVAEEEIERAGEGLLDDLKRLPRGECGDDAVATGFEEEGADRECLFVVVYAEDRLLWPQCSLGFCRGTTLGWAPADRPGRRACWFAGASVQCVQRCPVVRPDAYSGA